ncbi:chromate transporter [Paenibacillus cremeus]|uniref:Chromate transporter n=1 Tax=Paenibacillus cremeus TaxID=2163881 RepID=A0A559KEL3_9BACL|nr:chromate transporter [Paenibacillus cremeus]TVY10565.1 chromate transporter [Paenibacillus cremeus]
MRDWKTYISELWSIFYTFLKISPTTFGGGYAMIPVIEREVVEKQKWVSSEEMAEMISVAGSAPGGIGVNAAASVGFQRAGVGGAAAAVIGITIPTFLIVFVLCVAFSHVQEFPKAQAALRGLHAGIAALITVAAYNMWKSSVVDKPTLAAVICTVLLLLFMPIHPIWMIVGGLLAGHVIRYVQALLGLRPPAIPADVKDESPSLSGYKYSDYFIADGI